MSIATRQVLVEGRRLDQPTFHELYEAMPPGVRAELIQGVVSMPSPVGPQHGRSHVPVSSWLYDYASKTSGLEVMDNTSTVFNERSELQPDLLMRILPEFGGRTQAESRFLVGAPELVVEISRSTRFVDLGPKLDIYERAGVLEYIVRSIDPDEVIWHTLENGEYIVLPLDPDGLYRSRAFPGLWLDATALLAGNGAGVRQALELGLNTPEHAAFAATLTAKRGKS